MRYGSRDQGNIQAHRGMNNFSNGTTLLKIGRVVFDLKKLRSEKQLTKQNTKSHTLSLYSFCQTGISRTALDWHLFKKPTQMKKTG